MTTWKKLKKALKDEFGDALHSAELHQLLSEKKIRKNESVQAYFFAMKEIAARDKIENKALFYYVVKASGRCQVIYTPRVCVDYRAINKIISKDRYLLPLMENVLDRLQDAQIFSTLDMKN